MGLFEQSEPLLYALPGILCLLAFLIGSLPLHLLIRRFFASQAIESQELIVFFFDSLKGAVGVFLATPVGCQFLLVVLGVTEEHLAPSDFFIEWLSGLFVVAGHCFSPWEQISGGKGVGVIAGVLLMLSPVSCGIGILVFTLFYLHQRATSLAYIGGLLGASIAYLVTHPIGSHLCSGALMVLLVLIRYEDEVDALLDQNR